MRRLFLLIGCLLLASCNQAQQGRFIVSGASAEQLDPSLAHVDKFFGMPNPAPANGKDELLLAFITVGPGYNPNKIDASKENGAYVSVGRSAFHEDGKTSFVYGMSWNRTNDKVAIGSSEFDRSLGNVFLVLASNAAEPKYIQIPGIVKSVETSAIILEAIQRCPPNSEELGVLQKLQLP